MPPKRNKSAATTPPPTDAKHRRLLAPIRGAIESGNARAALELGRTALKAYPRDPQLHLYMAIAADRLSMPAAARKHAQKVIDAQPHPTALVILAQCARMEGDTDGALDFCERALALSPGDTGLLIIKAGVLEEGGRFKEARAALDPLLARLTAEGREAPAALQFELAKLLVHEKSYDEAVEVIDAFASAKATPSETARLALYLRAKAQDRSGDYAGAFESATRANAISRYEFDPDLYAQQVSTLIEIWSPQNMREFPASSCQSQVPVFVAGMPRSGTSLIDQIIDAHPLAAGVGELASLEQFAMRLSQAYNPEAPAPKRFGSLNRFRWTRAAQDYVKQITSQAPGAQRVVNKALGNNKLVGLLGRLFPNTRVIHAMRDPRDVAVSCYMGGFNNRMHPWTTRLEWAACAWEQSQRLMEHWRRVLEIPILDVRYEELVADPEPQMRRLIEFLGLEWDEACRDFHSTRRTVRTLSYDQVNRPIYTSSAGRHARYAPQLEGVAFPPYPPA